MAAGGGRAVQLELRGHSMETAARQEYRRLMGEFFGMERGELPREILQFREFLKSADIPRLRASDLRLAGEIHCSVSVARDGAGSFSVTVAPYDNGT